MMKRIFLSGLFLFLCQSILSTVWATPLVSQIMEGMTDEQKAAQLILVYYTTPEFIVENEFGGVLIMQNMLGDPEKLKSGLSRMQTLSKTGVLVSIDQEGGRVNRMKLLPGWKRVPSAKEMSHWSDERITEHAANMAATLHDLGINLNLAPVLDPGLDHTGEKAFMAKQQRSFGNGNDQIIPKAEAYVSGFQSQGIASVSKHFPGYDVQTNSDHEVAVSLASLESVSENIKPFEQLASKVTGVMISSVHYKKIVDDPAVMSKTIVNLARQSHPDAILMTDDLWGEALRSWIRSKGKNTNNKQVLGLTRAALDAGNDMLMITYPEKAVLMKKAITRWMNEDDLFRKRVDEAVNHVLINKEKMGLIRQNISVVHTSAVENQKNP